MTEIKKVNVKLKTMIKQDNEISNHIINQKGTIEETPERYVISFIDKNDEGTFVIRFDLLKTGEILLNRQSNDRQNMSDFYFKEHTQQEVLYKTNYGTMNLFSETKYLETNINADLSQGEVKIEYLLFEQKQLLGEYKLRLIFNA